MRSQEPIEPQPLEKNFFPKHVGIKNSYVGKICSRTNFDKVVLLVTEIVDALLAS